MICQWLNVIYIEMVALKLEIYRLFADETHSELDGQELRNEAFALCHGQTG